ncbi:MAG: gliding motility-associated C-terminal domain-containing protein [Bacteroidota bacterium]|nr:gliding motility-associated C-terminal domain-containing protein [Bacteroidota bacterium]
MLQYFLIILLVLSGRLYAQGSGCEPVISITLSQNNVCSGTTISFQAAVANGGTNPTFNWKKNGISQVVSGNTSYTSSNFQDGDIMKCEYSCISACGKETTVVSNAITLHVFSDVTPTVTVSNTDTLICQGEMTTFTATAFYGDAIPNYYWTVNGNPVGTNSSTFATNTITNGARVECLLTISSPACPGITKSASSQLTIYVYPLVHPIITIATAKTNICKGEEVTFTALANGGAYPSFRWKINGVPSGDTASSFITDKLKDNDTITCTATIQQDSRCHESTTTASSNVVIMHVHDFVEPSLSLFASALDVCAGTPLTFTVAPQNAGGLIFYQWQVNGSNQPNNSSVFSSSQLANGDKVSCSITTNITGCTFSRTVFSGDKVVTIRKLPTITFPSPQVWLTPGESTKLQPVVSNRIASFKWQPAQALLDPQTLSPATIPIFKDTTFRLTVVDEDGCVATNAIRIKVLHKLQMPSAFSPNHDGKNDLFRIPPSSTLDLNEFMVFDRWGTMVFYTTDIKKGWDGTVKSRPADSGTYVYFIQGRVLNNEVSVKGTVVLIR